MVSDTVYANSAKRRITNAFSITDKLIRMMKVRYKQGCVMSLLVVEWVILRTTDGQRSDIRWKLHNFS